MRIYFMIVVKRTYFWLKKHLNNLHSHYIPATGKSGGFTLEWARWWWWWTYSELQTIQIKKCGYDISSTSIDNRSERTAVLNKVNCWFQFSIKCELVEAVKSSTVFGKCQLIPWFTDFVHFYGWYLQFSVQFRCNI